MKRIILLMLILSVFLFGCGEKPDPTQEPTSVPATQPTTKPTTVPTTVPTTEPTTEPTNDPTTEPTEAHSPLYIDWLPVEDVIMYFNEVVLDAEYNATGSPNLVQKWVDPISYWIAGAPTDGDLERMDYIVETMNAIEGFPGFVKGESEWLSSIQIYFCNQNELWNRMGPGFSGEDLDGAVTFWYNGDNEIYSEIICVRSDIDQSLRNSVLLEEIYNGLGPVQDTLLRTDSIISQSYNEVQQMTKIDLLILQLLYHPDMKPGMNAAECEAVIRQLYY